MADWEQREEAPPLRAALLSSAADDWDWKLNDATALRSALSTMDDWDGDLSSLFGFDSDYSSGSDVTEPKKPKTRETTAPYKQRKQEIAALRVEVEELQNVLALEKTLLDGASGPKSMEEAALQAEWERMAASQKHQRFAAQLENKKLRKLLQSQSANAEKILNLTKRVKQLEEALPVSRDTAFDASNYRMAYVNPQAQLKKLDKQVSRANAIFSTGAFAAEGLQCFRGVQFGDSTPAVEGVDFVIEAAWVLPFEVARVADALWIQTTRPTFRHKTVACMDIYEDASSLATQFMSTRSPGEDWGASQGQWAVRRFPPDPSDGSILIGINTRARAYIGSRWKGSANVDGWLQIKRVLSPGKPQSEAVTQVKWHRRAFIGPPENAALTKSQRCKWTHSVISGSARPRFEQDLDWSLQAIENLLLTPEGSKVV